MINQWINFNNFATPFEIVKVIKSYFTYDNHL